MKSKLLGRVVIAIAAAGGLIVPQSASAALVAQQQFDGATFGFNPGNSPYAFEAGTLSPNLTYLTLTTSGSSRTFSSTPQASFAAGPLSNNSVHYVSFLLDTTGDLGSRTGFTLFASYYSDGAGGGAPLPYYGGGTGTEVAEIGQKGGQIRLQTGNYGPGTPEFQDINSGISTSAGAHLYVFKIDSTTTPYTSTISLWYDPTSSFEGTPLLTFNVGAAFHLEQLRAYGSGTWDEIRVGESFADVTPGLPIPEPASAALAGLGLGFVLLRRNKRQKP